MAFREDNIVVLKDPKWDLGSLGKVLQNVIQKDWYLLFLCVGWGMMILLDKVDEMYLLRVIPRTMEGFQ